MKRRIMLVHNQQSGSSVSPRQLRSYFIHAGYEVTSMVAVSSSLAGRIERALHHDPSLAVAAVGGDGTISAVAGILSGTDTPLIPIPGGTLNNFSKDLGISQDLEEAIRQAATAPIRQIDTAEVNGTIFLNNSSIGLYPLSLRTREVAQQKLGKWPAALYGVIKAATLMWSCCWKVLGLMILIPTVLLCAPWQKGRKPVAFFAVWQICLAGQGTNSLHFKKILLIITASWRIFSLSYR